MSVAGDELWAGFVTRVRRVARERGGHSFVGDGSVQLNPPPGSGETVVLSMVDEEVVRLETGFVTSLLSRWDEADEQDGVLPLLAAVLDGRVTEVADVAVDGRWFQVRTVVRRPDGRVKRESRRPATPDLAGATVASSHERPIPGWSRGEEDGEEEVEEGLAGGDG